MNAIYYYIIFCVNKIGKKRFSPRLSNNHSGFLCHVTSLFYSNYTIGHIYPSFNAFYVSKNAVLKWKTLSPHINFTKTTLVKCSV